MKDLVEHIRTIHFTLLVIVLTMTVALYTEKKASLVRAASDAALIQYLADHPIPMADAIFHELDVEEGEREIPPEDFGRAVRTGTYAITDRFNKRVDVDIPVQWLYVAPTDDGDLRGDPIPEIENLGGFFDFWDGLQNGRRALVPIVLEEKADGCSKIQRRGDLPSQQELESKGEPPASPIEYPAQFSFTAKKVSDRSWEITPTVHQTAKLNSGDFCTFKTVTVTPVPIKLRDAFRDAATQAKADATHWDRSSSDQVFSDLKKASKDGEHTPLQDLAHELDERAKSETESVELFNAKVPGRAIPIFGTFLLICCELYLLAHLSELKTVAARKTSVKENDLPTGYIGLYNSLGSVILSISTLIAAPLIPFGLLCVKSWHSPPPHAFEAYLAVSVISFIIGCLCAMVAWDIRKTIGKIPVESSPSVSP